MFMKWIDIVSYIQSKTCCSRFLDIHIYSNMYIWLYMQWIKAKCVSARGSAFVRERDLLTKGRETRKDMHKNWPKNKATICYFPLTNYREVHELEVVQRLNWDKNSVEGLKTRKLEQFWCNLRKMKAWDEH